MPRPVISVVLTTPTVPGGVDLAPVLSQETNAVLSSVIEDPTGTNDFTTGDVSLKGYDAPGGTTVSNYFSSLQPASVNHTVVISLSIVPPGGVITQDVVFSGYVAPNTVQFEPRTGAFSFTVIGFARNLQTTPADTIPALNRTAPNLTTAIALGGYWPTKWILQQDVSPLDSTIRITVNSGFSTKVCDFQGQDQIQLGGNEKFTVVSIASDGANPPVYWVLGLNAPPQNKYTASSQVAVTLLTPYVRNVSLQSVVTTLFNAAGFLTMGYFGSAPLPFLSVPFASPVNTTGLPSGGAVTGISPVSFAANPQPIAVGTPGEVYQATSAISGFTPLAGRADPPIDPTNSLTTYIYTGQKQKLTRASAPRFGLNATAVYYAYDPSQYGGTQNRYVLTITLQADSAAGPYNYTTLLQWQSYNLATDTWGGTATLWAGLADTTSSHIPQWGPGAGICVDTTGTIFFVDVFTASSGSAFSCDISSYQPTGATPATGTLTRHRAVGYNGQLQLLAPGVVGCFQTDGFLGTSPNAYIFTVTGPGVMTLAATQAISPYLVPNSIKLNRGDGLFYGLVSDPVTGVTLQRWTNSLLNPDISWTPASLFPGPPPSGTGGIFGAYSVDLIAPSTAGGPGSGQYPMYVMIAGALYYVSTTGSGVIAYADATGLSVADMLQQLSVLNAGIFYIKQNGSWVFRSRSAPMPGDTIGASDQIDGDAGFIGLTAQPVYNNWVGYVSVQNGNNSAIFGDTSDILGSIAYANTSTQGLNLQLSSNYVPSGTYASALAHSLYNYLGAKKHWIQIDRFRDGRTYEIGRTFHCVVDGLNRQFQIIEADTVVTDATVKVVGLEV